MRELYCSTNNLTQLDVSKCPNLKVLHHDKKVKIIGKDKTQLLHKINEDDDMIQKRIRLDREGVIHIKGFQNNPSIDTTMKSVAEYMKKSKKSFGIDGGKKKDEDTIELIGSNQTKAKASKIEQYLKNAGFTALRVEYKIRPL